MPSLASFQLTPPQDAREFEQLMRASPQTWVLAMKNPRILRGLRRFYRNDQDH